MKKSYQLITAVLFILITLTAWLVNMDYLSFNKAPLQRDTALERDGAECVAIAEKSVSQLVAVVEYQKLEIIGRKARVMRNCMDDHGYIQNPAWTAYATPLAEDIAKSQKISFNEAFENLRRQDMVVFQSKVETPFYWIRSTKKYGEG